MITYIGREGDFEFNKSLLLSTQLLSEKQTRLKIRACVCGDVGTRVQSHFHLGHLSWLQCIGEFDLCRQVEGWGTSGQDQKC